MSNGIQIFVSTEHLEPCAEAIVRVKKLQRPVYVIGASDAPAMNGHSVVLVPAASDMRRSNKQMNNQVFVRYAGAPEGYEGPAARCSGVIEVGELSAERLDSHIIHARRRKLCRQLDTALANAAQDLARRAKQKKPA